MRLQNNTDNNIPIFAGIFVPARGTLPVEVEMEHAVETSPLVQDYCKSGSLEILRAPELVAQEPEVKAAPPVKPKVEAEKEA